MATSMDWLTAELFWFLLGFFLIIAEFAVPGVIIMFFGIGAWITAFTTWIGFTSSLTSQNLLFACSSVILLFSLRHRFRKSLVGESTQDTIEDEFTGKEALALTLINSVEGKVEMKGAEWNARSPQEITARSWVVIERREGLTLHVRPR